MTRWQRLVHWWRANWALIRGLLMATTAIATLVWVAAKVADLIENPRPWRKVPGSPGRIDVIVGERVLRVALPQGVTSDQVVAVGNDKGDQWQVEIKHDATNRSGDPDTGRRSNLDL